MKKSIAVLGSVAAATLLLSLVACSGPAPTGGSTDASIAQPLKMGVINNFPPFEYEKDGKLTGFDIDVVNAILAEEKLKGDWQVMGFDGLIPALQSNQISLAVSDISVTDKRKQVVDFSDPYYVDGQSMAVAANSSLKSLEDLKGKTIVATQGTEGLTAAQQVAEKYGATVQTLTASDALFLAVTSGQADALVIDTSSVQYRIGIDGATPTIKMLKEGLIEAPTAIAVPKGNEALVKRLNEGLKKIKANGTYDKIKAKYFGN